MIFRLMLYGFGLALKSSFKIASFKDADFKQRLKNKKFLMQITMRDENKGRFYKLDKGRITSSGKISRETPNMLIEWQDSSTALETLMKKNPKLLIRSVCDAIVSGKLTVELEYAPMFSFAETVKEMADVYSEFLPIIKKVPYINKLL